MAEAEEAPAEEEAPTAVVAETPSKFRLFAMFMECYWKSFVVVLTPFILIPIMYLEKDKPREYQCLYCICILAVYWITEAVPAAITAMLPIFLFPVFGILGAEFACMCYMKETVVMFVGGLIVAIAIEYSGLHLRLALKTLLIVGCSHRRLSFGLFFVTTFVSMWITNTAATAMMAPIVTAILQTLEEEGMCRYFLPGADIKPSRTTICYFLGIAYSSTIGGTATYVGTGTNLSARDQIEHSWPGQSPPFHTWMILTIPAMILDFICLWAWMNFLFLGLFWKGGCDEEVRERLKEGKEQQQEVAETIRRVIKEKYSALGPIKWNEILTGTVFLFCVFLWLFRAPEVIEGWADLLMDGLHVKLPGKNSTDVEKDRKKYRPKDATAAMFTDILLFVLPGTLLIINFFKRHARLPRGHGDALLVWDAVQTKMPWGLIFVIGGGFSIAAASDVSGMSAMVGGWLTALKSLREFWIVFICSLLATNVTELTSNVAVLNILGPVIGRMGVQLKMNGPYLFVPVACCCSYSFMLPVGTPPNAVVAGLVNIPTKNMIVAGSGPTVFTLFITTVTIHFLSGPILGIPLGGKM